MRKKIESILLVDDDDISIFINQRVIQSAGISQHVKNVLNGKEAIEYLSKNGTKEESDLNPSLILLDINMPVMDGWEFLRAFQDLDVNNKHEIVIVVLTTSSNPDDAKKAQRYPHVSAFKEKPLTLEILDEIIKNHF